MICLAIILDSLAIIAIAFTVWKEINDNKSHFEAVRHELEQTWESINDLEGVDPSEVGNPIGCSAETEAK